MLCYNLIKIEVILIMSNFNTGVEYAKLNGHTIYQFENKNAYNYFLAIPDHYATNYQMFIGFPEKDLKETPKKDVINEIDEIKKMITYLNKDGIYVLPDIPVNELEQAAKENDGKKYNKLLSEKINPIISEAYQVLTSYNTAERTINQVIIFVKKTESDRKFVDWFEMNMPNFVHGISYDEIKKYYYEQLSKEIDAVDEKKDQIFENPNKYDEKNLQHEAEYEHSLEKKSVKKRILKPNNYGFGNMTKLIILLTSIILTGIIINNILFK